MRRRLLTTSTTPRHFYHYLLDLIGFVIVLILLEQTARLPIVHTKLGIPVSWGTATDQVAILRHFSETEPPDILIVGSSVAQTSIYPPQLQESILASTGEELTVISAAGNWLSADLTHDLVTEIIPQIHTPRMIIYIVFPYDFLPYDDSHYESRLLESSDLLRFYLTAWPLQPFIMNSEFIQYSTNGVKWLTGPFQPRPLNDHRGFMYQTFVAEGVEGYAGEFGQSPIMGDSFATRQFHDTLQWGQEEGVFFVVAQSPLPLSYRTSNVGLINQTVLDGMLRAFDVKFSNMVYLDLYAEGPLAAEDGFEDPEHANITGAIEWTDRLLDAMLREHVFEQAQVGIVRVYGDDNLVIFNLESQGILQFYGVAESGGELLTQLDAAEWSMLEQERQLMIDNLPNGFSITLEQRATDAFAIQYFNQDGTLMSDAEFAVPSLSSASN